MRTRALSIPLTAAVAVFVALAVFAAPKVKPEPKAGAIRVLFLGHESEHHNSNKFYPMLAKGLGRDAIYFDYVTSVEEALGDAAYLSKFDAVLLYANHGKITPGQWKNLKGYVEDGGGFHSRTRLVTLNCFFLVAGGDFLTASVEHQGLCGS